MSDNRPPSGGDDPTQAVPITPSRDVDGEPTRMQAPVGDYSERLTAEPVRVDYEPQRRPSLAAPLMAVGLVGILIGLGIGYLLFDEPQENSTEQTVTTLPPNPTTSLTTTAPAITSTTAARQTTTTSAARQTTTTVVRATTTAPDDAPVTISPPERPNANAVPQLRLSNPRIVSTTTP